VKTVSLHSYVAEGWPAQRQSGPDFADKRRDMASDSFGRTRMSEAVDEIAWPAAEG